MVIKSISFIFTVFVIMIFGLAISCTSIEKVETVEKVAEPKAEVSKADDSKEEHPKSEESSEAEHPKTEATEEVAAEEKAETTEEAAEATVDTVEKAAEETTATAVEEVSGQKAEPEKKADESVH